MAEIPEDLKDLYENAQIGASRLVGSFAGGEYKRFVSLIERIAKLEATLPEPQNAAAVDDYVAWLCFGHLEGGGSYLSVCDSDTKGAFKVYRHSQPSLDSAAIRAQAYAEALEHGTPSEMADIAFGIGHTASVNVCVIRAVAEFIKLRLSRLTQLQELTLEEQMTEYKCAHGIIIDVDHHCWECCSHCSLGETLPDRLMWEAANISGREDILGVRTRGHGRTEYLVYNKALCRPYYVALKRESVPEDSVVVDEWKGNYRVFLNGILQFRDASERTCELYAAGLRAEIAALMGAKK